MHDAEPVPERRGKKSCAGRRAHQRKLRQIQPDRPGGGSFADHNIYGEILHGRIKHFFYLTVQAVDLIHKEDVALLKIVEDGGHLSRLLDRRSGSDFHMYSHLIGDNSGKRGLTQSRRSVKQHMIQNIVALFCRFNIYFQCIFCLFLSDVLIQSLWTQCSLKRKIFLCHIGGDHSFFHICSYKFLRAAFRIPSTSSAGIPETLRTA